LKKGNKYGEYISYGEYTGYNHKKDAQHYELNYAPLLFPFAVYHLVPPLTAFSLFA